MPNLPASLTNPGLVVALCLIIFLVVGVNATLVSLFRRGPGKSEANPWSRAFGGARDRQRQQSEQLDALHRAVNDLKTYPTQADKPPDE